MFHFHLQLRNVEGDVGFVNNSDEFVMALMSCALMEELKNQQLQQNESIK